MIKVTEIHVMNIANAIRGARNPMNSWDKSDSYYDENGRFVLGEADLAFGRRLAVAGSDHRKFLRQVMVSMDITAPLYWWKEFDTYKVGTTADSTSTMHKIQAKPFVLEDFSHDRLSGKALDALKTTLAVLEEERLRFVEQQRRIEGCRMRVEAEQDARRRTLQKPSLNLIMQSAEGKRDKQALARGKAKRRDWEIKSK